MSLTIGLVRLNQRRMMAGVGKRRAEQMILSGWTAMGLPKRPASIESMQRMLGQRLFQLYGFSKYLYGAKVRKLCGDTINDGLAVLPLVLGFAVLDQNRSGMIPSMYDRSGGVAVRYEAYDKLLTTYGAEFIKRAPSHGWVPQIAPVLKAATERLKLASMAPARREAEVARLKRDAALKRAKDQLEGPLAAVVHGSSCNNFPYVQSLRMSEQIFKHLYPDVGESLRSISVSFDGGTTWRKWPTLDTHRASKSDCRGWSSLTEGAGIPKCPAKMWAPRGDMDDPNNAVFWGSRVQVRAGFLVARDANAKTWKTNGKFIETMFFKSKVTSIHYRATYVDGNRSGARRVKLAQACPTNLGSSQVRSEQR